MNRRFLLIFFAVGGLFAESIKIDSVSIPLNGHYSIKETSTLVRTNSKLFLLEKYYQIISEKNILSMKIIFDITEKAKNMNDIKIEKEYRPKKIFRLNEISFGIIDSLRKMHSKYRKNINIQNGLLCEEYILEWGGEFSSDILAFIIKDRTGKDIISFEIYNIWGTYHIDDLKSITPLFIQTFANKNDPSILLYSFFEKAIINLQILSSETESK